ncbi:hypothetical protein [Paludisphaera soli]|uniref:hypothetical protein n=1 Tax=Paludisphaera soli TaxID=2712865 RepID=UPI0013EE2FE4|nr:hypothetical protein [Paludisphaera soli]
MTQPPEPFILRAIRVAYATSVGLALLGAVGGWYYWPGTLAWLSIFLGVVGLIGGIAITQLLSRFRMILWLLPFAAKFRAAMRDQGSAPPSDADRRRR